MENLTNNFITFILTAFEGCKPVFGVIFSIIGYVMFPEKAHLVALTAVLSASMLDIFTKLYSIIKTEGSYKKAVMKGKFKSKSLWKGTEVKIVSYLIISILTGLAYRVVFLKEVGVILASFVYSVMFLREFQSNIENLMNAGADLGWLLIFTRGKIEEITKEEMEMEKAESEVMEYDERV